MNEQKIEVIKKLKELNEKHNSIIELKEKVFNAEKNTVVSLPMENYDIHNEARAKNIYFEAVSAARKKSFILNLIVNLLIYFAFVAVSAIIFISGIESIFEAMAESRNGSYVMGYVCIAIIAIALFFGAILIAALVAKRHNKSVSTPVIIIPIIISAVGLPFVWVLINETTFGAKDFSDLAEYGSLWVSILVAVVGIAASALKTYIDLNHEPAVSSKLTKYHNDRIEEAKKKDAAENERYQRDIKRALRAKAEEIKIEIKKYNEEINKLALEIDSSNIVSVKELEKDPNKIVDIMKILKSNEAETLDAAISLYKVRRAKAEKEQAKKIAAEERRKHVYSDSYKGRSWDLTKVELTATNIHALELDAEALMYSYQKYNGDNYKRLIIDTWFSKLIMAAVSAERNGTFSEKQKYITICDNLKSSGSWKLQVLSVAIEAAMRKVLYNKWRVGNETSFEDVFKQSGVRCAITEEEKEYFSNFSHGTYLSQYSIVRHLNGGALPSDAQAISNTYFGTSYGSSSGFGGSSGLNGLDSNRSTSSYGKSFGSNASSSSAEERSSSYGSNYGYSRSDADKKAYIVDRSYDADLKVYFTSAWESNVKYWIVNSAWEADVKIYPVSSAWEADIKAFRIN